MSDTTVREQARDHFDEAVGLRRTLHRHPEQGNELPATRETVLEALEGLPLDVTLHDTTSGFTALLTGDRPGPTILLRADMDALPLHEDTGLEFSSRDEESMHACGHDTHTAMLVSVARVLTDRRGELAGRVLFMFQPGEEGHHGARFMLDEGLLAVPDLADGTASPVDAAFAMHITSALPTGFVATRPGPVMASADRLQITITGKGGHASEPHRAVDPIPVACEIVQALQTMITRSIDVFDPSVVTVARIAAGTTNNVIPESAEIEGTIRAVSEATRTKVHDGIRRVVDGIASAHGVSATTEVEPGYPVTVNDDDFAAFSASTATEVVGADRVITLPNPVMGAEDFSYVLHDVPGTMMFLGATPHSENLATAAPNHSNRVYFEESAMQDGIAVYSAVALAHLGGP
ncbi:MAG: amidohydrolase [Acidimicrobiia bacterium]|jgi:hippurate hydrolase|nr:amidohydrolase [Acidimicrobiia bacterium]MDQ3392458.1 M20 family metallopeptidase [Actinomycetota bacterium]